MLDNIGPNNLLLPFDDLFPDGCVRMENQLDLPSLVYSLLEECVLTGISQIYIDAPNERHEILSRVLGHLPNEFTEIIVPLDIHALVKPLGLSRKLVQIQPDSLIDRSLYGADALSDLITAVQTKIFYFYVAREHSLTIPTWVKSWSKDINQLRSLLTNNSMHARLTHVEHVFESYRGESIPAIQTTSAGWKYIKNLEPQLCDAYSQELVNLGSMKQFEIVKSELLRITKMIGNKLSSYELVYRAIDIYEGTKIEKALQLLPKEIEYVPPFIGEVPAIQRHQYRTRNEIMKIWGHDTKALE